MPTLQKQGKYTLYIPKHLVEASVSLSGIEDDLYIAKVSWDTAARNWVVAVGRLLMNGSGFTCASPLF